VQHDRFGFASSVLPRLEDRFPDRKQADDEDDDIDAVEQLRNAEREARVAGELIDADESDGESEEEAEQSFHT
jgi:hypothetical protein